MSTEDITEFRGPCPCSNGQIVVEYSIPDHPWARLSQGSYSGHIDCATCGLIYSVEDGWSGNKPRLLRRADLEAKSAAAAELAAFDEDFTASPPAKKIIAAAISAIDAEKTKAARYRCLSRLGLVNESLATYSKRPFDGTQALSRVNGKSVIHIASLMDWSEDAVILAEHREKLKKIEKIISDAEPKPVSTGLHFMKV